MNDIRIRIYRIPKNSIAPELAGKLLDVSVRVRGYLLIATREPRRPEDALVYLVHNDDLRPELVLRYDFATAEALSPLLPVGHVTPVPVDCCEEILYTTPAKDPES